MSSSKILAMFQMVVGPRDVVRKLCESSPESHVEER